MRISGNKIIITGATEGIGRALTFLFIKHGNQVIAVARHTEKLNQLSKSDPNIIPYPCDIANTGELNNLIEFIKQYHPDTNILINNAGIQYNYNFLDEEDLLIKIDYEVNLNFTVPLKLIALSLPILEKNSNSAIVNISSGLGLVPKKQAPVYCGTKGGIHIFSKSLRYQLEKTKVFEVIPPLVDTAMTKGRGKGKISPEKLAEEFLHNFKKDNYEINIGKVKLLKIINRMLPSLAERIMKNGR